MLPFNRIDFLVSSDIDIVPAIKALSITKVGIPYDGKLVEGAIYRLRVAPSKAVSYPYLVVSDNLAKPSDILTLDDLNSFRKQAKMKLKKGTGIEVTVNPVRKMDSNSIAKWFADLRELYRFCHSSRCQLIISSGASSKYEMVSGPCFDAIFKIVGIEPQSYWSSIEKWLQDKLIRNGYYVKQET
ncbi:MAG: hypothetical protein ACJ70Z_07505 [Nitrososphaera sp.]